MRYLLSLIVTLSVFAQENKIVCVMATPRSLSSAFFRVFENRNDFRGFHEATMGIYDLTHWPEDTKDWIIDDLFESYDEMKQTIYDASEKSHVIVKDVSFSSDDFYLRDEEFIKNPKTHFVFLIRHPYWILNSFYKNVPRINDRFYQLCGLELEYKIYKKIKEMNPNGVQVIFTDDLLENPEKVTREVFDNLDLEFSEKSLSWDKIDSSFTGRDWYEQKTHYIFQLWHGTALQSTKINPRPRKEVPCEENLYSDVANSEDRELMIKIYKYHLPFYEKLLEEKANGKDM